MKTFVARFVRPSGGVGVIHIMASSSMAAMLSAMKQVSDATGMSVRPSRRAALFAQYPDTPPTCLPAPTDGDHER